MTDTSKYDISIIIPVYGVEDYIEECLRSVMVQKAIDKISIECIVVDDCGPDKSIDIAERIIDGYNGPIDFKIVRRKQNGGLSAARNSGIHCARGEYLYFLDSDDYISPDCISRLWQLAEEHPGVEIVYGKTVCVPDPEEKRTYLDLAKFHAPAYSNATSIVRKYHLLFPEIACNRLIKTSWLKDNELYFTEGLINEDFDWHLRAHFAVCSYSILLYGEATYLYRQRENSIMTSDIEEARHKRRSQILRNVAATNAKWDNAFFSLIYKQLKTMKLASSLNFAKNIYNEDIAFYTACHQPTVIQRISLAYMKFSAPWMHHNILPHLKALFRKPKFLL